jgi:hypothetical protein
MDLPAYHVAMHHAVFRFACFGQVERQIENMCRFIKQEAEEKANEIRVSAEEVSKFASRGRVLSQCCHNV